MRSVLIFSIFLSLVITLAIYIIVTPAESSANVSEKAINKSSAVERGEYLVTIAGCHDCHTPKKFGPEGMSFDMDRQFMGHPADDTLPSVPEGVLGKDGWGFLGNHHLTAFVGPWGISFSANLTPDNETGIGTWTEEMFIKAMRTGQHMGEGRPILPPMPWFNLAPATDEDLEAIFAYFMSIEPIHNPVPEPIPPQ